MTIQTSFLQMMAGMSLGLGLTVIRNCSLRNWLTIFRCFFASLRGEVCMLLCFIRISELLVVEALMEIESLFGEDARSEECRLESADPVPETLVEECVSLDEEVHLLDLFHDLILILDEFPNLRFQCFDLVHTTLS